MTIASALQKATLTLTKTKITAPRLEAALLLAHALKKPKEFIFAHPEHEFTAAQERRFFALVKRRATREPFAYITGHKEFYGLDFLVNRHTLIPRPETETLIEAVLREMHLRCNRPPGRISDAAIMDVGTGSGAIAITLAKLLPSATVYATDTSRTALRVARQNAKHHNVHVHFKKGNLMDPIIPILTFGPIGPKVRMTIIANLPYLTTAEWRTTQPEVKRYEPRAALDGGPDGLKYYRQLVNQIKKLLIANYHLLITLYFEIDPRQAKPLTAIIHKKFLNARVEIKKDLSGRNRVLVATLPSAHDRLPQPTSYRH